MAQQLLNTGTVANDGTGTTWKAGGDIINENFTELYASNNANNISISQESDFPNQDSGLIYLDLGNVYTIISSFSTAKTIVFQGGTLNGQGKNSGITLTYSGSGQQFSAIDFDMRVSNLAFAAASGEHFSFTSTSGNAFALEACTSSASTGQGSISGARTINILTYTLNASTATTGFVFAGTGGVLLLSTSAVIAASSGFVSFDLGSAVFTGVRIEQFFQNTSTFGNDTASVAISGLASSGNVAADSLMTVDSCNFVGLTSPFTNISPSDIRWEFMNSPPFENSSKEADSFLTASSTVVIASTGTFVQVASTNWISDISERFSTTTSGVITFIGERSSKFLVTMTSTVEKVGGGSDEIESAISLNSVTTGNSFSKSGAVTQNADPTSLTSIRLVTLSKNDTISSYVANNTSTANITVSKSNISIIEVR